MSEQVGIVKLKGKIDGVSFYERDGKHFARMAKGPSKEKIARDSSFERTRENNNEFRGCMAMVKTFRHTFASFLSAADSHFTGRLTAIIKEINKASDGARGRRAIELSKNRVEFINYDFNVHRNVTDMFTAMVNVTRSDDRRYASLGIDNVLVKRCLKAPEGATHVQFTQVLGMISDYAVDSTTGRYAPIHGVTNINGCRSDSDFIPLNSRKPISIKLENTITEESLPDDGASVFQCIYVCFYELINDDLKPLKNGNAFKVLNVY